jgi:hypothetical protein
VAFGMAAATATFGYVPAYGGRSLGRGALVGAVRTVGKSLGLGLGSLAFVGATGAAATLGAAWLFAGALSASHGGKTSIGPGVFVHDMRTTAQAGRVVLPRPVLAWVTPDPAHEPPAETMPPAAAAEQAPPAVALSVLASPPPRLALASKAVAEQPESVPLPRPHPHPAKQESAPQVAVVAPPPPPVQKPAAPQSAHSKAMVFAGGDVRTAVYDISARSVYLPNGDTLEAHSGLGDKMDDPRFIKVRMRGPTPPNVYNLALREKLFHGVQAIRLKPVDEGRMFGRDGMLAHSYLLGPSGQSNGCVSFKDYDKFLDAFLDGQFDRLVVVSYAGEKPPPLVARAAPRPDKGLFAAAAMPDMAKTW